VFDLTWVHPENWNDLETIHFRIANDEEVLLWVRLDVAENVLTLIGDDPGSQQEGSPDSNGKLHSRTITVDLKDSAVFTSGPQGRSILLRLALRLKGAPAVGTYRIEVFASDIHGNSQGFAPAGTLTIVGGKPDKPGKPGKR
jgi:hypothetical protein